jgi:hypothetical protein
MDVNTWVARIEAAVDDDAALADLEREVAGDSTLPAADRAELQARIGQYRGDRSLRELTGDEELVELDGTDGQTEDGPVAGS